MSSKYSVAYIMMVHVCYEINAWVCLHYSLFKLHNSAFIIPKFVLCENLLGSKPDSDSNVWSKHRVRAFSVESKFVWKSKQSLSD